MKLKKRILSLLMAITMTIGILPSTVFAEEAESSSTPTQIDGVYQIEDVDDLIWLSAYVNAGNTDIQAALTDDIDLSGEEWTPIGTADNIFSGFFDGQNHKVIFKDSSSGLFGYVYGAAADELAQIENVIVEGSIKSTDNYVAGIAGKVRHVSIKNCINRADISSTGDYVAGIAGYDDGGGWNEVAGVANITNCGNEGDVSGTGYVAGILGYAQGGGNITGCSNTGLITGTGANVGGIAGYLQGYKASSLVSNCYNQGKVSGSEDVGGLVGNLYNSAGISNSYNAGSCYYAIAGNVYNATAAISNTYYLSAISNESVPYTDLFDSVVVGAKSRNEMSQDAFAAMLGDSFVVSCPYPVLSWQTATAHKVVDGVCSSCGYGSTEKSTFDVTLASGTGYVIKGASTVTEGDDYTFQIEISSGYSAGDNFEVRVNGVVVAEDDGVYTYEDAEGPLNITVSGVIEGVVTYLVNLPEIGNGYRVNTVDNFSTTVEKGGNYQFTVTFVNGFKAGTNFAVKANGTELTVNESGVYTIENIREEQTVTVEGVDIIPVTDTADVNLTITYGENEFYVAEETNTILMMQDMEVPYFDLSLYGLEKYYYTPYCYLDEEGNIRRAQIAGNRETAYGNVTIMHALIYTTEVYYLGMSPDEAGTGASYKDGSFEEAISWAQDAGSSFMNFWDHGTNLNYYLNYEYPLAYEGWGATSDQILIEDGDVISIHLIEDKNVSGSNFAVFTANDADKEFSSGDIKDSATVKAGEKISLTLYQTVNSGKYDTSYAYVKAQNIYWNEEAEISADMSEWKRTVLGGTVASELVTDDSGTITIDTAGLEPGVYYIGALGGLTDGGAQDNTGFTSRGNETGAAVFKLTVLEGDETETVYGDLDGDSSVKATDAALVYAIVNNKLEATTVQLVAADVNGDGKVTALDAALIYAYVNNKLEIFPVKNKN